MSEELDIKEQEGSDLLDSLKTFLEDLVPPKEVRVSDVLGNEYDIICSVSARKQIKILREFDKIEEMKGVEVKDEDNILKAIVKIASNEEYLKILCRCFKIAHSKVLNQSKAKADKVDYEYEEGDFLAADLFSIEELATAIIPLFIRLARRTSQALQKVIQK